MDVYLSENSISKMLNTSTVIRYPFLTVRITYQ